jgi:hypothetical protein
MLLCLILLTTLTEPSKANECWIDKGIGFAPENVQPRVDLPDVSNTPEGILIPIETSKYLSTKLRCLWRWPEVCQSIINAEKELSGTRIKNLSEQIEELKISNPESKDDFWLWITASVCGGVITGLISGIIISK